MTENQKAFTITSSALSDRGLNERRPLNEDAYLADGQRSIFAVADGVGGAEAGEVASQTAIEVLDEAFRHHTEDADIEDLMELAIQRANASIHQLAQEHQRFSMMATTIVALHLKNNIATFGHVGDSRLYRLTRDGELHRETLDHSIVEEEVRAGRMTPEQAANHPSKNVISRALGAEPGVEVDMKTMEVEDGTQFLLCTDGITRHVNDAEIRRLLVIHEDLETVCRELKERCYERGAEDNLTVVVVRVGDFISADQRSDELEPTISPETEVMYAKADGQQTMMPSSTPPGLVAPSRIAFPGPTSDGNPVTPQSERLNVAPQQAASKNGSAVKLLGILAALVLLGIAFIAGARLKDRVPFLAEPPKATPTPTPTPHVEEPFVQFERTRRQVDQDSRAWLASEVGKELLKSGVQNPLESPNPEFLYLYGRANLLSGNPEEASKAFEASIVKADQTPSPTNATVKKEASLAIAAVSLKTQRQRQNALAHYDELTKPPANANAP